MHCHSKHIFIYLPIYSSTHSYRHYVHTKQNTACPHQTGRQLTPATCTAHPKTNVSIYRYISAHTVTDSKYIQNKIQFVHVRPDDTWTTAICFGQPNTTFSIYRYIAADTVTDSKYIQNKIQFVHGRPCYNWKTATCTAHSNTTLSIYRYIAAHTFTDSKYIQQKILILSKSDRVTTESLLHALPIQTHLYQSTDI